MPQRNRRKEKSPGGFVLQSQEDVMTKITKAHYTDKAAQCLPYMKTMKGEKWAVLLRDDQFYKLQENELSDSEALSLLRGKYCGRDIILTVSSKDIAGRIEALNHALGR